MNKIEKLEDKIWEFEEKICDAEGVVFEYGDLKDAHHKQWVIDQMIRKMIPDYEDFLRRYNTYGHVWDAGIEPPNINLED